ncbi:aspartate/glutamate racemase family protein [Parasedimentitalea psychrophila]|uniref:Aspartate/glutamate racemase family protein n=1 Tax=Parasedimentitalea psychrophila TaxID=2997337 RepID=A0A9Y2L3Q4_9RHOB|nr:aspartate/glutamate racemase family protein [Parasedimentitalea psychrophila]WIY27400.1 aspartate/glutamate racemase family protein [Parasedimentitalea psychrophila]
MRILMINPNTSEGITQRLANAARATMSADTVLETATASYGVPYISTRTEAIIGGMAALEILAERHMEFDAAIIAAFGDPGLGAARELFDIPVVGLAETGMLTACMLGGKFAVVTFAAALGPWYNECVAWHGLEARCAGVHMLNGSFSSIDDVQEEKSEQLIKLCNSVVADGGADTIVLAGAPLAGLAELVRDRVSVPLVDCAQAAIGQAETLARLRPASASAGSFRRPAAKPSKGLSTALAARIAHKTTLPHSS